jgi:hypothetical protein
MKDKSFFANSHDLRQKLNGTVVQYKGEPVYIECDGQNDELYCTYIGRDDKNDDRHFKVDPDDRHLDISSPPLGFANFEQTCLYIGRIPSRRSVQGLSEISLSYLNLNGMEVTSRPRSFFASKRLYNCIKGIYTPYEKIIKRCLNTGDDIEYSQAFARQFALQKAPNTQSIFLFHRTQQIGEYDRKEGRFLLIPTYNNSVTYSLLQPYGLLLHESE